jgi:malate dehydrogenase (oxaloacetate-decarboxylating)
MSDSSKTVYERSLDLHRKYAGKLETVAKFPIEGRDTLSLAYSPGVAEPCREIARDPETAYEYTLKSSTVAVISNGTAVLGLGNIGSLASLPVMEGKCVLFKEFGGLNAFPIVIDTEDVEEFIATVKRIAGSFGGINLEDISAPKCFEIERRLKAELDIPVMHDDQHGTAIVVLAGLINAMKITGRSSENIRVVVNGLGAAGTATIGLLRKYGVRDIVACDSKGIVSLDRTDLNDEKRAVAETTNPNGRSGTLADALVGADCFVGVSAAGALTPAMVAGMAADPIIFALANPTPEITPEEAKAAGVRIIATGRSDYPNQINNVLAFPGIFKGALSGRKREITDEMKLAAAEAIAALVEHPAPDLIIPDPFDRRVPEAVAERIRSL